MIVQRFGSALDGFPPHATMRIAAEDRAGPERLPRYRTRSAFANERLSWNHDRQVHRTVPKPMRCDNGRWVPIDGDLGLIKAGHWPMGAYDRGC